MDNQQRYTFRRIGSSPGGFVEITKDAVTAPGGERKSHPDWTPLVDIGEDASEYLIVAELPGVEPDSLNITCRDKILRIVCEVARDAQETGKRFWKTERDLGVGCRIFRIPEDADASGMQWNLHEGLLHVHLPKREMARVNSRNPKVIRTSLGRKVPEEQRQTDATASAVPPDTHSPVDSPPEAQNRRRTERAMLNSSGNKAP